MNRKSLFVVCAAALCGVGIALAGPAAAPAAPAGVPAAPIRATDVGNTKCAVSGEPIGDSKLAEVYDGKIYHLCCPDCNKDFEKDPAKYVAAIAADPAKFGVK